MWNSCNSHFDGWIVCWCGKLASKIPSECGTLTWWVLSVVCGFSHPLRYYSFGGGRSRRLFSVPPVCLFCISCEMERQASTNGLPGNTSAAQSFASPGLTRVALRVSSCFCNPFPHKAGAIMKLKCFSVKHSYSIPYGRMRRVTSMRHKRQDALLCTTIVIVSSGIIRYQWKIPNVKGL